MINEVYTKLINMKIMFIAPVFIIIFVSCHPDQATNFPILKGSFIGQKPPGEKPEVFGPGIVSTFMNEGTLVASKDGKELFWVVQTPKIGKNNKPISAIVSMKEKNGVWTAPQVASFSGGDHADQYLTMHPHGNKIFFNSNRKTNRDDLKDEWNIWYSENTKDGWSDATPLDPPINGDGNVSCFSVAKNNNGYFTKMSEKGDKIYRSEYIDGKYQEPEALPVQVNSVEVVFDSYISPEEDFLIVPVWMHPDAYGLSDVFVSFRNKEGKWSPLINLGSTINTEGLDGTITISPDGKYLFIAHHYSNSINPPTPPYTYNDILRSHNKDVISHGIVHHVTDVYWMDAKLIDKLRPKDFE